jgi:hypothetical protein
MKDGPSALVGGPTPANDLACAWVRVHRFGQGGQDLDPVLVRAGKRSAAQPWRRHNANNMCTTRDINRATASGEVHTTKVCAHPTPGPKKAGPSLDGGVLSVWVPTASWNSMCARRDKINTMPSEERARCGRQRHLQTTGSARWPALKRRQVCAAARCGTAGDTQTASSQGSVQPRLEGRVHNKVEGVSHLAFLDTTARRRCGAKKTGGSACCRGSRAARRRLQQVRLPLRGGDLTTDGSGLGVGVPGSGRSSFAAATHRNPSSGGLACRSDSGAVVLQRGDGLQLHRLAAQQCSSLPPFLFFSSRTAKPRLQLHGDCALLSTFSTPSPFPSPSGLRRSMKEKPQWPLDRGRRRILGKTGGQGWIGWGSFL